MHPRRPDSSPDTGASPLRDSAGITPDFAVAYITPIRDRSCCTLAHGGDSRAAVGSSRQELGRRKLGGLCHFVMLTVT